MYKSLRKLSHNKISNNIYLSKPGTETAHSQLPKSWCWAWFEGLQPFEPQGGRAVLFLWQMGYS